MKKFVSLNNNEVLELDSDNYISFNNFSNPVPEFFASDNKSVETALVLKDGERREYLVLNGDFRSECIQLLEEGFTIYDFKMLFLTKMDKHGSTWSSTEKFDFKMAKNG